jgi:hypothetical protein
MLLYQNFLYLLLNFLQLQAEAGVAVMLDPGEALEGY